MSHHAEPMDIDDESVFDNKENAYQNSNVLPRTPCTEKGYEELDVSELNMKLRYSITPAASPMSKSMSHCLDNRQNTLTDESLNNTVINEYENNLTRSLNSTLNKSKVLPLQALSTDIVDNRSCVLRSLDTATTNDITITVSNENEIDNLSFASSSSSMAHTPEVTTPTKEIPKQDGGSPIMRGLKSVLSMFRSSQSPIPPGDEDSKELNHVVSPADVPLPDSKPRAVASTPKNEKNKELSVSRRNSPHKESIVFNNDLEKELHWNDDSTIVFSSEKIPIHKLFFQDKPSKSDILNENVKHKDANSTVEFMDVSYSDLSIKDKTLHTTINRNKVNEFSESDGEFVDCETTFTQNDADSKAEELDAVKISNSLIPNVPENLGITARASQPANYTANEPFTLDTTKDIINSIDASHVVVEENLKKQLDFSTTDIVNQLSDLINESETSVTNSVETKGTVILDKDETSRLSDVQTLNNVQPEMIQNQGTSPVTSAAESSVAAAEQVSIKNEDLVHTSGIVCDTIVGHIESTRPKISIAPVEAITATAHEVHAQISSSEEAKSMLEPEEKNDIAYPSPVDIPLPNDDDINEITDNLVQKEVHADLKLEDRDMLNAITSQNALLAALDKSITETHNIQHIQVETRNNVTICPPSLLPSDVPLLYTDKVNTNNIPHEPITVVCDPVQSPTIEKPETSIDVFTAKVDLVNGEITKSAAEAAFDIPNAQIEVKADIHCLPSPRDIPLPGMNDDNPTKADDMAVNAVTMDANSVRQCVIENPDVILVEDDAKQIGQVNETDIIKTLDIVFDEVKVADDTLRTDFNKLKEEQMEISFVECTNNKLSKSLAMDVSMVDTNVKLEDTLDKPESWLKETQPFKTMPEILEVNSASTGIIPTDLNCEQKSSSYQVASDKGIDGTIHLVVDPVSVTGKVNDLPDAPKSQDLLDENVNVSISSTTSEAKPPNAPPMFDHSKVTNIAGDNNEANVVNVSNLNHVVEYVTGIVATATPLLNDQYSNILPVSTVCEKKDARDVKEDTALPDLPEGPNAMINLNSSHKLESTPECVDEEIVLSESNSPFVSMSAEEACDPESKKEEFENIENPFSTKSKAAQSPPISPKIVSKGYNFNFDDIDNINPFATKTKIRMSPPPDASPNTSLVTKEVMNKTEIVEPSKNDKNINRRKSMPERKKPLKVKRHLNSTVDGTENRSSKMTISKNDDLKNTSKTELQQEQSQLNQLDLKQTDVNNIASVTHDVISETLDANIPAETAQKVKVHIKSEPVLSVDDQKENTSVGAENETITAKKNETKVIEDVVRSPSSSEQSTYFSAGTSSTELTDSKNVFNLPELDDFKPFATKSKIRQTPPRDLDMDNPFATKSKIQPSPETSFVGPPKGCNSTITTDNEIELKDATCNLSTCSGSSKTSEDKDVTVHEVHTEDEDTLEGPFLEADDDNDGHKIPQCTDDKVDVVDFDNLNQPDNDEAAEMFIDAEAFEFLMNQNKTDEVAYCGKESLFLKFDPLFARRVTSEGVAAALNNINRKQITPKKTPKQAPPKEVELLSFEKPVAGPSELNITPETQNVIEERSDDLNVTTSKPMMAVTPAVNPVVTPRKSLTPNRSNRLSMTFTSPAMAVIDRLLSLSGNSPSASLDTTVTHVDRSHSEADQALTQLRELLAEKEINVYNLRCESKELKDRLTILETQMKALETESAERLKKVYELTENLAEKTKMNRKMAAVVEEYERTIASLISETEQDKKRFTEERNQLIRDRDEQTAHLSSMEVSFNDLHSKYEKSKQVIMGYKTNEDAYKKSIQEFEENLEKMHKNYELLKQHATSKLNHANQELEKINKAHEAEVLKFNAMIKRKELHITSLEESLTQKTKANEELTAICDELINKVG